MFQGPKKILFEIFSNPETKGIVKASRHIYKSTKTNRWILSNFKHLLFPQLSLWLNLIG